MELTLIKFKITGITPLLMHSDRYSNPLDPLTKAHKELTSKRKKTDSDHEAISKSEWIGGLYYDKEHGLHMPGENIEACVVGGAKLQRLGTHFKRAVMVVDTHCPLDIGGKNDIEHLKKNIDDYSLAKSVVVSRARIMRVRPMFKKWSTEFTMSYNSEVVNESDVIKAVNDAGQMVGLGDWRPRYGRFEAEVIK
jgi:hypothetical protein